MLAVQPDQMLSRGEGPCSDCGHIALLWTRCFDQHTHSMVELCANCAPAFMQRQQFPMGCCGDV